MQHICQFGKGSNVNDLSFEGYSFVSNHPANKIGGGVGLFIDENIPYKLLPEFNVFVEICIPRLKNIIIGVIYRPPSQNTLEFVEKVNEIISGVTKVNKHCYITGDFNLDLLKNESQFIESLFAFRFLPMITKPTFRDAYRQHLYEQFNCILKKWFDHKRYLGYHLPIFSIVFGDHLRKDSNSFTFRDTSEKRVNEFRHKLENTNWDFSDQANNANDPNTAYNIFIDEYTGLFDACFLFKTIKGKAFNSFRKPWLTKSLLR